MKRLLFLFTSLTMLASSSLAGPFQITPMRLALESGGKTGIITVFNSGDTEMNMQVRAMAWAQDKVSGADKMSETKALIFFPKIFSIPANSKKIIRLGYQGEVEGNEKSFRLFVRELPVDEPGVTGARFAVQISMPAFIYPAGVKQPFKASLNGIEVHDGKLMLRSSNTNRRYYSLNKLDIIGTSAGKEVYNAEVPGWYVLAGSSRLFPLAISRETCLKMDSIALTAHVMIAQDKQGDTSHAEFPLSKSLCQQIIEKKAAQL